MENIMRHRVAVADALLEPIGSIQVGERSEECSGLTSLVLTVYESARIIGRENIEFGDPVLIDDFVLVVARERIVLGDYVHLACFSSITGGQTVEMGDFSALSQGARILTGTDDFTGHGFGNSTLDERYRNTTRAPVRVGRFCIIGANAVVLPGVTIGEGAVVGAGSVVTRDLDPWGVYVGNRRMRDRDRVGVEANHRRFLEDLEA